MELRIFINNRGKQFAGISRDNLCDFQYGIQYQFPYSVRYRQLESITGDITEESPDSFVGLKPLHRAKYVVLHHRQREAGNLSREVHTLTSAEVEQLLLVVICHLSRPSHGVGSIGLEEAEREVRGEQSVPLPFPASLRKEQSHGGSSKFHVYSAVGASERPVVLGKSLLLESCDNLIGCQVTPLGVVLGLAQLYYTNQVALDMATGYQANELCTGKPAVNQQIVETYSALDGILHHLDGLVGLLHGVFLDALLDTLSRIVSREALTALLVRQSLFSVWSSALLPMKREVEEQLAHAVAQQQSQALVTQDTLMLKVREYLADEFTLTTALWSVRVIDNQADRLVMRSLCTVADLTDQLEVHGIQQLAPFNVTVIHKTIEHVFLTTEQAA